TDPYQPLERERRLTRQVLEVLLRFRHPLTIVTKGSLILRDLDLLRELARRRGRGADLMPVVFTSGIGSVQRLLGDGEAPRAPRYMISQT
ncbi:hypothetical protein, partial [Acinetobacter pittii]|uniref:hypothetical protein n=1 Tax=Acinetobacter pittii TaxID=48296 RepID=UPI003F540ED6